MRRRRVACIKLAEFQILRIANRRSRCITTVHADATDTRPAPRPLPTAVQGFSTTSNLPPKLISCTRTPTHTCTHAHSGETARAHSSSLSGAGVWHTYLIARHSAHACHPKPPTPCSCTYPLQSPALFTRYTRRSPLQSLYVAVMLCMSQLCFVCRVCTLNAPDQALVKSALSRPAAKAAATSFFSGAPAFWSVLSEASNFGCAENNPASL